MSSSSQNSESAEKSGASIQLLLSDVDGTLLTPEKTLTARSVSAVARLREAGIRFTIASSRPLAGMRMLVEELKITEPVAAFNGGLISRPDLSSPGLSSNDPCNFTVLREHIIAVEMVEQVREIVDSFGLHPWLYTRRQWYVLAGQEFHVAHEESVVKFSATVVPDFTGLLQDVIKLVGVSEDFERVAQCEKAVHQACGEKVSATRSQPYYLDVTHPDANKGETVSAFSEILKIPLRNIATIGDGGNDVLMFQRTGLSIAMGNAAPEVRQFAKLLTTSNVEEGFANAVDRFILAHAP